jgi:hypothetical protein
LFVAPVDLHRLGASVGPDAPGLHLGHIGAEVNLWFPFNLLGYQGSMVNPGVMSRPLQGVVCVLPPLIAPLLQHLLFVPVAVLLTESIFVNVAHGQHDVGVWVFTLHVVKGHVRHHALTHKLFFGILPDQSSPFLIPKFFGQRYLNLTAYLRILPLLALLNMIP